MWALLARIDDFELFHRQGRFGWQSLKLVRKGNWRKRNWQLGWNGERMSRSEDDRQLRRDMPEIHDRVLQTLARGGWWS